MENILVKLSKYLDSKGKYVNADKVDTLLRESQFQFDYFRGQGNRQDIKPDDMFNVMNQLNLTRGFNPELTSGAGRQYTGQKLQQLTPKQLAQLKATMSPTDFARMIETEQVGTAGNLATFIQGRGLADLNNILMIVRQNLNQEIIDPKTGQKRQMSNDDKRRIFKERFSEPISNYISGLFKSENNITLIANAINQIGMSFNFPEMNQPGGAIEKGINDVVQSWNPMFTQDQNLIKKYNEITQHPFLKQFVRTF